MQEYEYIYEQDLKQSQEHDSARELASTDELSRREAEQLDNLLGQELASIDELIDEENVRASFSKADALEEMRDQRATRRLGRGLAVGLGLSFLACLAALWLSSTLISAPDQILPLAFLQMLAANRVLVLCVPAVCLVVCYLALRSLTGEIMAVPERRLDERQKMLRDQAQRSAFKIIKFSSILIPIGFLLPHLPWFNPAGTPVAGAPVFTQITIYGVDGNANNFFDPRGFGGFHRRGAFGLAVQALQSTQKIQSASGLEIALAGGVLLLTLLLTFSALPMAILAWKGKA